MSMNALIKDRQRDARLLYFWWRRNDFKVMMILLPIVLIIGLYLFPEVL